MMTPSGEYAESRPFKIFISLLDKWEIGTLLTEALVLDAFKSIKRLSDNPVETGEDVSAIYLFRCFRIADVRTVNNDSQYFI